MVQSAMKLNMALFDRIQEIWKETGLSHTCSRCGRTLKDEESIRRGIGPVCQEKLQMEDLPVPCRPDLWTDSWYGWNSQQRNLIIDRAKRKKRTRVSPAEANRRYWKKRGKY